MFAINDLCTHFGMRKGLPFSDRFNDTQQIIVAIGTYMSISTTKILYSRYVCNVFVSKQFETVYIELLTIF